ncbi:MAG: ATP-binding protein [Burkholderiales bacterium]
MGISQVIAEFERIREKNSIEESRRLKEVLANVPGFEEARRKLREAQRQRILNAFGDNAHYEALIKELKETERKLLADAGYDIHYLDPIYSCGRCCDTGFLEDGGRCECFRKRVLEDKLSEARLNDAGVSFEKFDLNVFDDTPLNNGRTQRDYMAQYKKIAEAYANELPASPPIFLISGGTGLGKTYLSKCVMRRVMERGYMAAFYTAYRLFSIFHQHRLGEDVDISPIFEVPLLVIDDLGTEPMTRNVTKEYLFDLINERNGLHTIIVTNLTFNVLKDRYGERIHSRLMDKNASLKILLSGKDIRY